MAKKFDPADIERVKKILKLINKLMKKACYKHEATKAISTQVVDTPINFGYRKEDDRLVLRHTRLKPYVLNSKKKWQFRYDDELPIILLGFMREGDLTFNDLEKFCICIT